MRTGEAGLQFERMRGIRAGLKAARRRAALAALCALVSACATTEPHNNDPRYDLVEPTWGELFQSLGESLGDVVEISAPSSAAGRSPHTSSSSDSGSQQVRGSEPRGISEVVVKANGESLGAARDEAVRTALMATVEQLVVTDRLIENGEMVRNDILATQNGFVTGFEVLEENRNEFGEVEIRARVGISGETILNYVAMREGAETEIDGAALFAELQRSSSQRDVLSTMLDRFLKGYPWDVVSLQLDSIVPVEGRDDLVMLSVTAQSDSDWFIAAQQFFEQVAVMSYMAYVKFDQYNRRHAVEGFVRSEDRSYRMLPMGRELKVPTSHASAEYCFAPKPREREMSFLGITASMNTDVDEHGRIKARCYLMPAGEFLPTSWGKSDQGEFLLKAETSELALLVTLLDENGQSVVLDKQSRFGGCLLIQAGSNFPGIGFYMNPRTEGSPEAGLPFRIRTQHRWRERWESTPSSIVMSDVDAFFELVIDTESVDISRATIFRGRPVLFSERSNQVMKDMSSRFLDPKQVCQELQSQ